MSSNRISGMRAMRAGGVCRAAAIVCGVAGLACEAGAEALVGLTIQNGLITFDSATPGTIAPVVPITGLTAGDVLIGIDRRPQALAPNVALPGPNNGRLYSIGLNPTDDSGRIYTLDEVTGAASLVATLAADPADSTAPFPFSTLDGNIFGFDFNPVVDRLRVTSDTGQNLRINVDNGLVQLDGPLAYQSGDANFGDTPSVVSVAYANSFGGATSTTLRGVDISQDTDALVVHTNPNGGTLSTSLALPFNSTVLAAYDVSGLSGTPYFVATSGPAGPSELYAAGLGGVTLVGTIGGGVAVVGLAAPVGIPVPEPTSLAVIGAGAGLLAMRRRRA